MAVASREDLRRTTTTLEGVKRAFGRVRAAKNLAFHTGVLARARSALRGVASGANGVNRAFTRVGQMRGLTAGLRGAISRVLGQLVRLGSGGSRNIAIAAVRWAAALSVGTRLLRGIVVRFADSTTSRWDRMGRDVRTSVVTTATTAWRAWDRMRDRFVRANEDMAKSTQKNFGLIIREVDKAMKTMGISGRDKAAVLAGREPKGGGGGGGAAKAAAYGRRVSHYAAGGRIPGQGLKDTVPVAPGHMAAPGELIVNRHTEHRVDRRLRMHGTSLNREVGRERRPHSAPGPSPALSRARHGRGLKGRHTHAKGGRIVPIPGQPGESIASSILPQVTALIRKYQLKVGDGFATGGHAANSDHYWGGAIDVTPAKGNWGLVDQLARWAEPRQGQPAHGFRWVGYDGDPNHGRGNHLHLSWPKTGDVDLRGVGGGSFGSGGAPRLKRRQGFQGPGAARRMVSQRALDNVRRGYQGRLNKAGGGGAAIGATAGGILTQAQVMAIAGRGLRHTKAFPDTRPNRSSLTARAKQESGFNAGVTQGVKDVNSGGNEAVGLMQIIPGTFAAFRDPRLPNDRRDPFASMVASIRYMKSKYGKIMGATGVGYALGGRIPGGAAGGRTPGGGAAPEWGGWHARGGNFTARRPTLIGVGERGAEDVSITPRGSRGGQRPVRVSVQIDKIENHRRGDIRRVVKHEIGEAFDDFRRDLQDGSMEEERGALR